VYSAARKVALTIRGMLYSHKRVLTSSTVKIAFVLPTGCDARSLS
jgi:hypothetical protein